MRLPSKEAFDSLSTQEKHMVEEFEENFDDWLMRPEDITDQSVIVRLIYKNLSTGVSTSNALVKDYVFEKLVEFLNKAISENIHIVRQNQARLTDTLFKEGAWVRFRDSHQYLLATCLIGLAPKDNADLMADAVVSYTEWTGRDLNFNKGSFREDMASALFGQAWALLYNSELQGSIRDIAAAIQESTPSLTFTERAVEKSAVVSLPGDLTIF